MNFLLKCTKARPESYFWDALLHLFSVIVLAQILLHLDRAHANHAFNRAQSVQNGVGR